MKAEFELSIVQTGEKMSFNCPNCESENTQRIANIYSSGTTSTTTNNFGAINGMSVNTAGDVGVIGGNTHGSSTTKSQTAMASQFSPPSKQDDTFRYPWALMKGIGVGLVSVGIIGFFLSLVLPEILRLAVQLCIFCLVIYKFYKAEKSRSDECKQYNATEYVKRLKEWESRFFCHKCSHVFAPSK